MSTTGSGTALVLSQIRAALPGCGAALLAAGIVLAPPAAALADATVPAEAAAGAGPDEQRLVDLVADAQRLLSLSGYDAGPIDGHMGPRTQRAIRAYQDAARRLGTLEALKGPPPDDPAPRPALVGADRSAARLAR